MVERQTPIGRLCSETLAKVRSASAPFLRRMVEFGLVPGWFSIQRAADDYRKSMSSANGCFIRRVLSHSASSVGARL